MAQYVGLGDADQKRLDCKEWLPISLVDITAADLEELSDRFSFDPLDWPEPLLGTISLEDSGQGEEKRKQPRWYARALAWMALRQNGHDVTWDECGQLQILRLRYRSDEEPGKADGDASPSENSDGSTTAPSPSSSD